ncbi:MAG TPA: signal peptidase II [Bacilli bacterium]|nr:MAG: lipoprotein signal peptidase [Tenericutes bacterium ADurb.BinA124]HPN61214.1 signal peptidase II [Bacilli bacterium]
MKGKQMLIGLSLIVMGIIIDQITKLIAFKNFADLQNRKAIPGIFKFVLLENEGAGFGVLQGKLWFFIIITIVALGFLAYLAKDFDLKENAIFSASYILIVIGTIGNFIDRLFNNGLVRDFLTFDFMNFPSFNFADMCLTVGVFFLTLDILFGNTGVKWTKSS